jgi:hypothetical protein
MSRLRWHPALRRDHAGVRRSCRSSHVTALGPWTAYLPGVAADGLTQASQAGVRLLTPWQGGLVFAAWTTALAGAGATATARRDIT